MLIMFSRLTQQHATSRIQVDLKHSERGKRIVPAVKRFVAPPLADLLPLLHRIAANVSSPDFLGGQTLEIFLIVPTLWAVFFRHGEGAVTTLIGIMLLEARENDVLDRVHTERDKFGLVQRIG